MNYLQQHLLLQFKKKKNLRQKTESSLPNENEDISNNVFPLNEELTKQMRRTSSMPSVVIDTNAALTGERIPVRHYNYDIKLSKLQKRALRFTWHRLHTRNGGKRVENVFEEVFERLTKVMPVMREMFTTRIFLSAISKTESNSSNSPLTLREHGRLIVRVIDCVIKNLDVDDRRRTDTGSELNLLKVGKAHGNLRPYGFTSTLWEKLGEMIIDVVLAQEAVRDLPGAGQAWVVLAACLVDQLRAGFESSRDSVQIQKNNMCPAMQQMQIQQQRRLTDQQNQQQKQYIQQQHMYNQIHQQKQQQELKRVINEQQLHKNRLCDNYEIEKHEQLQMQAQQKKEKQRLNNYYRNENTTYDTSRGCCQDKYCTNVPVSYSTNNENVYFDQDQKQVEILPLDTQDASPSSSSVSSGCSSAIRKFRIFKKTPLLPNQYFQNANSSLQQQPQSYFMAQNYPFTNTETKNEKKNQEETEVCLNQNWPVNSPNIRCSESINKDNYLSNQNDQVFGEINRETANRNFINDVENTGFLYQQNNRNIEKKNKCTLSSSTNSSSRQSTPEKTDKF